ncbi:molecular chaperone [Cupriavidus sp. D39]|uniref:fimbrial biogenesis chaperone n=1 Tax=Cupriavidus sp. D39 TaxID=2997877 RepID=UPI0022703EF8|nr:fimbria/pilus periplasmic chaperone [Cupriavidus sp. D39]MCY0858726.1 fimbria/pilus periplasmic chaperone [Cupriavidus sp. D39]
MAAALTYTVLSGIIAVAGPAFAGSFSVSPVRIYMKPRDRAVAVAIVNEGNSELVLQADLNAWSQQPNGADDLVLSDDLILSPPIIKLAPNARQVVRLAQLKPPDLSKELTYRLVVREVPEVTQLKDKTVQLPIALALSMPVFITPPNAQRKLECQLVGAAKALSITCANSGTAYAQVREVLLTRDGNVLTRFNGGVYILPGASKTWALPASSPSSAGAAKMNVGLDDGQSQMFDVYLP